MIPRTLQIKNFLSYGTDCPPISFDHHTLICLSGNNGHGKSALLDAITWAVWGHARKIQNSVRAEHGLLRLGQTSMIVIFECTINTISYRIKREFELVYGKPKTTLDIGIIDVDGIIHSLTEKTIRDTQACIETIVGLDYETFINSCFLRQGNANEFSKRSPKERKDIISTILGLGVYDTLKKAALEKVKIAQQESLIIKAILVHADQEKENTQKLLNHYPLFCEQLKTITEEYTTHKKLLIETRSIIAQQEITRQLYVNRIQELNHRQTLYTQKLETMRVALAEWRTIHRTFFDHTRYIQIQKELREQEALYAQAQKEFANYMTLKEQIQEYDKKQTVTQHLLSQKKAQQDAERRIILERLENAIATINEQIKNSSMQRLVQEQELGKLQQKIINQTTLHTQLSHQLERIVIQQKQFEKRKEAYQRWSTLGNIIRDEHNAQLQKMTLANDQTKPSCPLCEQSLSAARKRFLHTKIGSDLTFQMHRLTRLKRIIPQLKKILINDHATLQIMTQQKTELHTLEHTQSLDMQNTKTIQLNIEKIHIHLIQLQEQEKNLTDQKATLEKDTLSHVNDTEMKALETEIDHYSTTITNLTKQLAHFPFNPSSIALIHAEIQRLQKELILYEKNQQQQTLQTSRKQTITQLCTELKKEKVLFSEREATQSMLTTCINILEQLRIQESNNAEDEQKTHTLREQLLIEQGTYHAAQTSLTALDKTIAHQTQILKNTESIASDYHTIATAVGKDGIQALLIEEAIPEIEEYANDLLAKLTNNNAHIMIESLRDLKSGGTKETLDIKISDAQGIRPYEMFSGGEAFRIDFALRIAISKLLAHRAGTALQTLIIDEGFGSQDEEGLSVMMDLLHALQDEFAKIIVVSHLPIMKDQFPVHFHVEKGSQGSIVHIIEQG